MKTLLIAVLFLASCSPNKNEVMTNLINQKKVLEDSSVIYGAKSIEYLRTAKGLMSTDTSLAYKYADSSSDFSVKKYYLKEKITAVTFSIDSLSKMN